MRTSPITNPTMHTHCWRKWWTTFSPHRWVYAWLAEDVRCCYFGYEASRGEGSLVWTQRRTNSRCLPSGTFESRFSCVCGDQDENMCGWVRKLTPPFFVDAGMNLTHKHPRTCTHAHPRCTHNVRMQSLPVWLSLPSPFTHVKKTHTDTQTQTHKHTHRHTHTRARASSDSADVLADPWRRGPTDWSWSVL